MQYRIAELVFSGYSLCQKERIYPLSMFALATSKTLVSKMKMSAENLPIAARALSVIIAIALVASVMAPVIFAAARLAA